MIALKSRRREVYTLDTDTGLALSISHMPHAYTAPIIHPLPDGRFVVGYLVQDEACENPLESCDGMGKIYDLRRRHSSRDTIRRGLAALGADADGNRVAGPNPYAVLLDVYEHSGEAWRVHGSGQFFPDERWDVSNGAGVWVPDEACVEHIDSQTIRRLGITLEPRARKEARREEAARCAQQAVDEYNKWLAGECFGVVIDVVTAAGEPVMDLCDACWGCIGSEYAQQQMTDEVENTIKRLTNTGLTSS